MRHWFLQIWCDRFFQTSNGEYLNDTLHKISYIMNQMETRLWVSIKKENKHFHFRTCNVPVCLLCLTLLLAVHPSITQQLILFWELSFHPFYFVPQLNRIYHLFHTFTAGWRPESNRASFFMMLPTPGMMAWSRRTSHSILLLWLLTASSEREKLNFGEHTSRLSIARTLCSQSSVNLQGIVLL